MVLTRFSSSLLVLALLIWTMELASPTWAAANAIATTTVFSADVTATHPYDPPLTVTTTVTPAPADGHVRILFSSSVVADQPIGAGGVNEFQIQFGAAGSFTLRAEFLGSTTYAGSLSGPVTFTVTQIVTTLSLQLEHSVIHAGDSLVAHATVSPVPDNSPYDEEQVGFRFISYSGYTHETWALPDPVTGVATVSVPSSNLVPEPWTVTAIYPQTVRYAPSEDSATFNYAPLPPKVTLTANPLAAYPNQSITFTVTVNPTPPGGTIQLFYGDSEDRINQFAGTKSIGGTLGGTVTFTKSFGLNEGLFLRAVYSGTSTTAASRSPSLYRTELYDWAPPVVTSPSASVPIGATSGSLVPVVISWPAATDAVSGVASYELQVSVNGGSWSAVSLATPLTRSVKRNLTNGYIYGYRVRARDVAGNVSGWQAGAKFRPLLRQETSTAIADPAWTRRSVTGAWGGYVDRAKSAGSSATTSFVGSAVGWISTIGPGMGQARIYVDGTLATTIDLYSSSSSKRRLVWQKSWSTAGSHSIQIRVVGTLNRPAVDLDALVIVASP